MASEPPIDLLALAKRCVETYRRTHYVPPGDLDDLLSDACLGAVKGWRSYDPTRGTHLEPWVWTRACGEMLDGIRERTPVGRWTWARGVRLADLPTWQQPATHLEQEEAQRQIPAADDALAAVDLRLDLDRLLNDLPQRDREVLRRRYLAGEQVQTIAGDLGVHGSRVSQIIHSACRQIRAAA